MNEITTVARPVFDESMNAAARRDFHRRAAAWERSNDANYPAAAIARDDHAIETGLRRLNAWLEPRGLHLAFYGLYPTLEDEDRHKLSLAW